MKTALALLAGLLLVVGCNKQPSVCNDSIKAYEEALTAPGAGACTTDADCKCYNGGISDKQPCGGVSDTKTSEKLASIAGDYSKAQCKSGINCAAWMCTPACEAGKCTVATAKVTSAAPVPSAPPMPPSADGGATTCASRVAEIDRVLASATTKCSSDKDCACFRGGVSKKDPCGGIVDAKTNERFEALAKQWSAAGCTGENVACPAMVCEARCNAGTCGPHQIIQ